MESTLFSISSSTVPILSLSKSHSSHSTLYLHGRSTHLQLSRCTDLTKSGQGFPVPALGSVFLCRSRFASYAVSVDADAASLSSDVIILDVGGMTCGGCSASVKRILESQPQVSSADVNLTTGTAIIWPVSEAKVAPNWQKDLGEVLAKHLTTCGFSSNLRGQMRELLKMVFNPRSLQNESRVTADNMV